MGGAQKPLDKIVRQRIGQKLVAHIAPRADRPVDRVPLIL